MTDDTALLAQLSIELFGTPVRCDELKRVLVGLVDQARMAEIAWDVEHAHTDGPPQNQSD